MNQEIINFSLQTHIFSGFIAIFMFWTVIFMRKGTQLHKKIGTIYFLSMNVVVISSILNCMYYIHEELTTGSANKGGRYTYTMLFIASFIAIIPLITAIYAQKTKLVDKSQRTFLIFINSLTLIFCFFLSIFYILIFPSITVLGAVIVPFLLVPTILYLKNFNSKKLLNWHIKWMIQSGTALHVAFLGGGFSYRYLNNQNVNVTLPLYGLIFITVMIFIEKYFIRKYVSQISKM